MNIVQLFDRFQLEHNLIGDDEINSGLAYQDILKPHINTNLRLIEMPLWVNETSRAA
jgi:hypothetical protein